MKNAFHELKRRNVFRALAAYVVIGWLLLQVSTALEEALSLPDWFDATVTALLAIGLPIVAIFSWVYEITPEGVLKTEEVDSRESITGRTGMRLNYITTAGIVLLLGMAVYDRVSPDDAPGTGQPVAASVDAPSSVTAETPNIDGAVDRSIAVLPFVAMSSSQDDEFFADGLSEEILNVLANIEELKVAGRTSSFYYKGRNEDLRVIAESLDVAHILEGSVRRSGNRLRVTAQLIKADDGFHLWSETFDRVDGDVFAIQDEISTNVARALQAEILGDDGGVQVAAGNADAENFYLIAQAVIARRQLQDVRRARNLYAQASELDPDNPKYLAGYAQAVALQFWNYRDISSDEAISEATAAVEKALALADPSADTLAIAGLVQELRALTENDADAKGRALQYYLDAIKRDPVNLLALQWLASIYLDLNEPAQSLERFDQVVDIDPLNYLALTGKANALMGLERFDEAREHLFKMQALFPQASNAPRYLSDLEYNQGRLDKSAFWIERSTRQDPNPLEITFLMRTFISLGWADKALEAAESFRQARDGMDVSRFVQAMLDKDFEATAEEANALFEQFGENDYAVIGAWANAKTGACEKSIEVLDQQFPSLKGEVVEYLEARELRHAVLLAHCHAKTGNTAEAQRLTQIVLESKILGDEEVGWFAAESLVRAAAHSVRGEIPVALETIQGIEDNRMPLAENPLGVAVDESPVFEALYQEDVFKEYARRERYQIARQARLLAAGETEAEVLAEVEAAGFQLPVL